MSETGNCRRCGGEVPQDATRCQHCGYDTSSHSKWRWVWGIPGFILLMSIIGIPLALPMLWKARKHRLAYKRGVAA